MAHEIKFSLMHLKNLVDEEKDDDAKTYINKFFYNSGVNVFYYTGDGFVLYEQAKALKLLSDEVVRFSIVGKKVTVEFSARKYLESIEFKEKDYRPIVDFSSEEKEIVKVRKVGGIEMNDYYVNMSKPCLLITHRRSRGQSFRRS